MTCNRSKLQQLLVVEVGGYFVPTAVLIPTFIPRALFFWPEKASIKSLWKLFFIKNSNFGALDNFQKQTNRSQTNHPRKFTCRIRVLFSLTLMCYVISNKGTNTECKGQLLCPCVCICIQPSCKFRADFHIVLSTCF